MEENTKNADERLAKQLGDFGEALVMFILGQIKNYKVALVDHVGADIIATDREIDGKRYAISVKTRYFKKDGPQNPFDKNQQNKLENFAEEFGQMIPTIAFVMIDKEIEYVDIYIITLERFKEMANNVKGITATGLVEDDITLHLSNAPKNQPIIQNHEWIDHTRLKIDKKNAMFTV